MDILKKIKNKVSFSIKDSIDLSKDKAHCLRWAKSAETKKNFGDALNPFLFSALTKKNVVHLNDIINYSNKPTYYFIGSILDSIKHKNVIVCGAGFMMDETKPLLKPLTIISVRGPLSRQKYIDHGIDCPEVYGDPGLILSKFLPQKDFDSTKKYDVGIIPHYSDKSILAKTKIQRHNLAYNIIDIEKPIMDVVANILSCKIILSTSLHGIITAHSYGIPAVWLKISNNIKGGSFKFNDYYFSLGEQNPFLYDVRDKEIDLEKVVVEAKKYNISSLVEKYTDNFHKFVV